MRKTKYNPRREDGPKPRPGRASGPVVDLNRPTKGWAQRPERRARVNEGGTVTRAPVRGVPKRGGTYEAGGVKSPRELGPDFWRQGGGGL